MRTNAENTFYQKNRYKSWPFPLLGKVNLEDFQRRHLGQVEMTGG